MAQEMPVLLDERRETIPYAYPPPDSTYKHDEIIIYFRPTALWLHKLCYEIWGPPISTKNGNEEIQSHAITNAQLREIYGQRFYADSLIASTSLLSTIKCFGGDSLRRITIADPCHDTLSIGKNGDTLRCYDYLWMVLHIDNDTSALIAAIALTILHQDMIVGASLNFKYYNYRTPSSQGDPYYNDQRSLQGFDFQTGLSGSGFDRAWDFQVGNENIRVAVLDDGIDYRNCDLGNGYWGSGYKIIDGYNFWTADPNLDFSYGAPHGTNVAGIIGAYTNRSGQNNESCPSNLNGISGIAGGWDNPDDGIGCKLIAMNIHYPGGHR